MQTRKKVSYNQRYHYTIKSNILQVGR